MTCTSVPNAGSFPPSRSARRWRKGRSLAVLVKTANYKDMAKKIDLINKRFGRLIAIKSLGRKIYPSGGKITEWLCYCDCGKEHKVLLTTLLRGEVKSCGCLQRELAAKKLFKHGMAKKGKKRTRFYQIWAGMKTRCTNKKRFYYKLYYGGIGIKVCDEWMKFENFKNDMYQCYLEHIEKFGIKNTTIDRIDPYGNYKKENCRWATIQEQNLNQRRHKNKEETSGKKMSCL